MLLRRPSESTLCLILVINHPCPFTVFLQCIKYTQQPNSIVIIITSFPKPLKHVRCTCQWFPFHVHLIPIHCKWTFQQLHCYNMLGAVYIPFITTDRDFIASQLADDLVPKCYFRDYFLGLFLALRSWIAFPGKQTKRRIGLSRVENWVMMKLQQRIQLTLWGSLWIWIGPSEVLNWGEGARTLLLPYWPKYHWIWATLGAGTQISVRQLPSAKGNSWGGTHSEPSAGKNSDNWENKNLSSEGRSTEKYLRYTLPLYLPMLF